MRKPTVSDLCDLLNKPQLINWANKLGLEGKSVGTYRSKSLESGTNKHSEIENFLINGECMQDLESQLKVETLFKDIEIIGIEESFENEYFRGRSDIRFIKDGKTYIGDFKSKFKRPYIEHYIQLFCYKMHFNTDEICIIDLKNYKIHEFDLSKSGLYEELIYNLVKIYNIKQQL